MTDITPQGPSSNQVEEVMTDITPQGPSSDQVEEVMATNEEKTAIETSSIDENDGDEVPIGETTRGTVSGPRQKQGVRRKRNQSITSRRVQCFGRKKRALALAICGDGYGMIRVNGRPLDLIEPKPLRMKVYEPLLLVGKKEYQDLDIHIRVKGGGHVAQIYAVRQAIAKCLLAWHAKHVDEASKHRLRKTFLDYDRNLIVADPRRRESKKFGGPGPRAKYQKSYR